MTIDITVYDKDYNEVWSQLNLTTVLDYDNTEYKIDIDFFKLSQNWKGHMMVIRSYSEIDATKFLYV